MGVGGSTMLGLWRNDKGEQRSAVSAEFEHALAREVLQTELIRIKALIATALLLLVVMWAVDLLDPEGLNRIWRGGFRPAYFNEILIPFILFEVWVHANITRHLKLDRDVPVLRRYLGALIETTLPTIVLAVHIENMGRVEALGFVMPLAYFI